MRRPVEVLLAGALLLGACSSPSKPPVERARSLLEDDGGFGTAIESGDTFAHVAELLLDAGPTYRSSAAWAQVVAAEVLDCTQPGVHDARAAMLDHLATVTSGSDESVPSLPDC